MKTYPICLINLSKRRVLVIGGGQVALRKVLGLLDADASLHLISPKITKELEELSQAGKLDWSQRNYRPGDLDGVFLVIAATDDPAVNQAVWEEAQQESCLINVVDDPARCNFILPALARRGDLTLAVSSGGNSPALSRRIREKLEDEYGPEFGHLTAILGDLRPDLLASYPPGEKRLQAALRLIDSELMDVLKQDGYAQARRFALEMIRSNSNHE
jgi:precorrin-2 dehydrogenase / sirohydrochlorin ferrochelatase